MREGLDVADLKEGKWDLLNVRNKFVKNSEAIVPELAAAYDEVIPPLTANHLMNEVLYRIKQETTGALQTDTTKYFQNAFKKSMKGIKNQRDIGAMTKVKGQQFWTLMKDLRSGAYDSQDISANSISSGKRALDKIMQDVMRKYATDPVKLEGLLKSNREFTTTMDAIDLLDAMKNNPYRVSQLSTHMMGLLAGATAANPLAYMAGRGLSGVGLEKWSRYMLNKALNKDVFDSEVMRNALTQRIQRLD